jgi:AcrR family transcriptional regulator
VPRAGLTTDRVVAAAADLADDEGFAALSLAGLAKRVGVATPSLYKHVDGLEGLRRHLAALAVRELGDVLARAAAGRSRAAALTAVARAYRDHARRHPGRYAATLRAPEANDTAHQAATREVLETVLAVLGGYGIEGDDAVDAARFVRSALHGFSALEGAGGFGLPRDLDRSFDALIDGLDRALTAWAPAS